MLEPSSTGKRTKACATLPPGPKASMSEIILDIHELHNSCSVWQIWEVMTDALFQTLTKHYCQHWESVSKGATHGSS